MSFDILLNLLQSHQAYLLNLTREFAEPDYKKQFHPDLSPLGWHLGHCVFTEDYWIREMLLGGKKADEQLAGIYTPELSKKTTRGQSLPTLSELCDWAETIQTQNRQRLVTFVQRQSEHQLMQNNFLINFLVQHYAQHCETAMYVCMQRLLQQDDDFQVAEPLQAKPCTPDIKTINNDEYEIGTVANHVPYDNEQPVFTTRLNEFHIASTTVNNAEYLGFMQAGGYQTKKYWSEQGWQWCAETAATQPGYWRYDNSNNWYGINADGPYQLAADDPVYGINYYEACAFANWSGARLPHEYEWETAKKLDVLTGDGGVWEWCANCFHPYAGFHAYPYDNYSLPYFDDEHYTLRGGSCYTRPVIKRATFRNYYQADKRHIYAGIRLAFDSV